MFASSVDYEDMTGNDEQYYDREKYVMWGFSAHHETLNLATNLTALSGQEGTAAVIALMEGWHPALRQLVHKRLRCQ
jgi:hypothetical protein